MLPTIRGKSFLDCTLNDIKTVVDNADYRENEYIDYATKPRGKKVQLNSQKRKNSVAFTDQCDL